MPNEFSSSYSNLTKKQPVPLIVISFNTSYQSFVRRDFPNTTIVVAQFHLIHMLERVPKQTCVQLMLHYTLSSLEYLVLKHPNEQEFAIVCTLKKFNSKINC
ncbi:transposase [Latilactobacillus curvatus]|uniref:transposase n=1 Tax=Latilactobacillus curvatus TaxID=28038 RepID=UPI003D7C1B4B